MAKLKTMIAAAKRKHARNKKKRSEAQLRALRKHSLRRAIKDELLKDSRRLPAAA